MSAVTPFQTARALAAGYAPRVLQPRGWVLAGLVLAPVGLALLISGLAAMQGHALPASIALTIFHGILAKAVLPIMALITASAGIREDLEQRTLPLLLTRPAPAWAMPLGKGLPWFAWGAAWLIIGALALQILGGDSDLLLGRIAALTAAWWAMLAFVSLLGLLFKRGTLWAALWLFGWESLTAVFPPFLQRLTFTHYIESLAGSRGHPSPGEHRARTRLPHPRPRRPRLLGRLRMEAPRHARGTGGSRSGRMSSGWRRETGG